MIFSSCEKDLYEESFNKKPQQIDTKFIRLSDVDFGAYQKLVNPKSRFSSTQSDESRIINDTINNFSIDGEQGVLIQIDNFKSYTFKVIRPSGSNFLLENVVVSKKNDSEYQTVLYQYDITPDELERINNREFVNIIGRNNKILLDNASLTEEISGKYYFNGGCYEDSQIYVPGQTCGGVGVLNHTFEEVHNGAYCSQYGTIDGPTPGYWVTLSTLVPCGDYGGIDTPTPPIAPPVGSGTGSSGTGVIPTTPVGNYPESDDTKHVKALLALTKNKLDGSKTVIKEKIDDFKLRLTTDYKEDGAHFIKNGNAFSLRLPSFRGPQQVSYVPDHLVANTKVVLHMHTVVAHVEHINRVTGLPQIYNEYPVPIFSHEDIYKTAEQYEESGNDNDFTSILVTEEGVFALRIGDGNDLEDTLNTLGFNDNAMEAFKLDFKKKVLALCENSTNSCYIENFVLFIKEELVNGHNIGLLLYQAVFDANGNIINWIRK